MGNVNFSLEVTTRTNLSDLPKLNDIYITFLPGTSYLDVIEQTKRAKKIFLWNSDFLEYISQYTNTNGSLNTSNFFVSVEEANGNYSVFKCLYNNKDSASTDKPTKTETSANDDVYITTADKYQWKYMYELTAAEYLSLIHI